MKVMMVYEADNGDVFFEHDNDYVFRTNAEIDAAIVQANVMYEQGKVIKVNARHGIALMPAYYNGNEFIGQAGIHILKNFSQGQNFIFLKYNSNTLYLDIAKEAKSWVRAGKL